MHVALGHRVFVNPDQPALMGWSDSVALTHSADSATKGINPYRATAPPMFCMVGLTIGIAFVCGCTVSR